MNISPTKALDLFVVSKPTLYADMKSGKLSFSKTAKGRRKINIAELERVYPKRNEPDGAGEENSKISQSKKTFSNVEHSIKEKALLEKEIQLLKEQVTFKDKAIEEWQEAFNKAQNTADKITALLEHHSTKEQQKSDFNKLIEKVDGLEKENQKLLDLEQKRQEEKVEARRKAQEAHRAKMEKERIEQERVEMERSKGFFAKLFG